MVKVVVIGDVGGWLPQLTKSLEALGVDVATASIPKDLVIIQLGDLIHKGPYSKDILNLVNKLLDQNDNPDTGDWVQLYGNHELLHLPGGISFITECTCDDEMIALVRKWWTDQQVHVATGIRTAIGEDYVITHAGVTSRWWRKSKSKKTEGLVRFLNSHVGGNTQKISYAGVMMGRHATTSATPIWAEASQEVYPSWSTEVMPFTQIHGHSTPFAWSHQLWYPNVPFEVRKNVLLDMENRFSKYINANGAVFYGIDAGLDAHVPDIDLLPVFEVTQNGQIII